MAQDVFNNVSFTRGDGSQLTLSDAIDKLHMKTPEKLHPHITQIPGFERTTKKQVKEEVKTMPRNSHPHDEENYYYPTYSNHLHGWEMDLLEQSKSRDRSKYPAFWLIFININTKFACAIPCEGKTITELKPKIAEVVDTYEIKSLVCDEEPAFMSQACVDMLTAKGCSLKVITDQRHSALAVIDRFIRTLRDMNTPTVKDQTHNPDEYRQSDNAKYRDFSYHRMVKLLEIYNQTIHSATGMTPLEMELDNHAEIKYIIRKIYEKERRRKIQDFELTEGTYVRYILPNDKNKKRRYKVSKEAYKISHKDGNAYALAAEDGTIKLVSRWRLFPIGKTLPPKHVWGHTFYNNRQAVVTQILKHDAKHKKYKVVCQRPDGSTYHQWIPYRNLRFMNPQALSPLEHLYFGDLGPPPHEAPRHGS